MPTRGYRDRTFPTGVLPKEDEQFVVEWLTQRIRDEELAMREKVTLPDGTQRPMNAWEVHMANVRKLVHVVNLKSVESGGVYVPSGESDTGEAMVVVGKHTSTKSAARTLIHERSNHEMRENVAPKVYGASEVICERQDNKAVRHRIARAVERNILG